MFDSTLAYAFNTKAIGAKSLMARIRQMNTVAIQNHEIAASLQSLLVRPWYRLSEPY